MQISRVQNLNIPQKQAPSFGSAQKVIQNAGKNIFGQIGDKSTYVIAKGIEKVANNKGVEKFISSITDNNKSGLFRQACIIGVSTVLSGFYVIQTLKNKDIEDKNKKSLALNQTITWFFPAVGAILMDNKIKKVFTKIGDAFERVNEGGQGEKYLKWANKHFKDGNFADLKKGLVKNAPTCIVFALMYRYITPVMATPLTKKIMAKIDKKHEEKAAKAQEQPKVQLQQIKKIEIEQPPAARIISAKA